VVVVEVNGYKIEPGADLAGADLAEEYLVRADLTRADLTGADLEQANLTGADLTGADLSGANLKGAHLFGANLKGANLRGANLRGADLTDADLTDADLTGANLTYTKFTRAYGEPRELDKTSVASLVLLLFAFACALIPMAAEGSASFFYAFLFFYATSGICMVLGLQRVKKNPRLGGKGFAIATLLFGNPIAIFVLGVALYGTLGASNGGCC